MDVELNDARLELESIIDEWWSVADAEDGSDKVAPDGKAAHLGRINEAGQVAMRRYRELSGDHADAAVLQKAPASFLWNGSQP